jgi:hypothetical protein
MSSVDFPWTTKGLVHHAFVPRRHLQSDAPGESQSGMGWNGTYPQGGAPIVKVAYNYMGMGQYL